MNRLAILFFSLSIFISCSKKEGQLPAPVVIPSSLDGAITEFSLTPQDINTPGQGAFVIYSTNTFYKVDFNAIAESQANAYMVFAMDTILTDQSREFSNLGRDVVAYFPVTQNQVTIFFNDGNKITGTFDPNATFGGVFGEQLIATWRDPADPSKPTQKAKNDIIQLVHRYKDRDGPGPGADRQFLLVSVSRR